MVFGSYIDRLGKTWLGESEGALQLKGNSVLKQIGAVKGMTGCYFMLQIV